MTLMLVPQFECFLFSVEQTLPNLLTQSHSFAQQFANATVCFCHLST